MRSPFSGNNCIRPANHRALCEIPAKAGFCTRSSTDRTAVSGTVDTGSIPVGCTLLASSGPGPFRALRDRLRLYLVHYTS